MSTLSTAAGQRPRLLGTGLGFAIAAGVPLLAYVFTLSGSSYWLDGGEFVAAAIALDIAHPPGHPLTGLYGKLWTLLPLGPLAFRVALGQAIAAALAAGFLFRACRATALRLGAGEGVPAFAVGLAGAWLWALSFGVWFQAVRPEVYALQALVMLAAIDAMVAVALADGREGRPLYVAAFTLGLGLTNHHLMAFLLFPALGFCAWLVVRRHGLRPLGTCAALGLLALLTYVYLPLRAATDPPANFGAPVTLERFYWVLSARVYVKNVGTHDTVPWGQRFGDMFVALAEDLHVWALLLAAFGLYAALRRERSRNVASLWLLIAVSVLGMRGWLGSVRGNPDALGYAVAGTAALAALASAGVATLLSLIERLRTPAALVATACALAALGLQWDATHTRADLSGWHGTDAFDDVRVRRLPTRSVLVAETPQTVFRQLELAMTEAVRPDLTLVPLPFLGYPGVADALTRAHPDLGALVASFQARGQLEPEALLQVAARRPVLTELDTHVAPRTYRALVPAGVLYGVVPPRALPALLPRGEAFQRSVETRLTRVLGRDVAEPETAHQLLWVHYMNAVYYAALGRTDAARRSAALAARLFPSDQHVLALQRALSAQRGPLDVRPFLSVAAQ